MRQNFSVNLALTHIVSQILFSSTRLSHGKIQLNEDSDNLLFEKYTVANAMALSVKLGIWESELDKFFDSIDHATKVCMLRTCSFVLGLGLSHPLA